MFRDFFLKQTFRSVESALDVCFLCLYREMESLWFGASFPSRNVALAGELSRKIDQNAKTILKSKKLDKSTKQGSKTNQTLADIDVMQI